MLSRVAFSDTDAQAAVHHARYLVYFENAYADYHRCLGLLSGGPGFEQLVLRALAVEYFAPGRFDDLLEICVRTTEIGRSSITSEFAAFQTEGDGSLVCAARQTNVLVDLATGKPIRVPPAYQRAVEQYEPGLSETGGTPKPATEAQ